MKWMSLSGRRELVQGPLIGEVQPDFGDLATVDMHHDHLVLLENLAAASRPGSCSGARHGRHWPGCRGFNLEWRVEYLHLLLEHLRHAVLASVVARHRTPTQEVHHDITGMVAQEAVHIAFGNSLLGAPAISSLGCAMPTHSFRPSTAGYPKAGPARSGLEQAVPIGSVYGLRNVVRGSRWCESDHVDLVDVAWRWLLGGLVAVVVGLAIWWTAFIFVPAGVVLLIIGTTRSVRAIGRRSA